MVKLWDGLKGSQVLFINQDLGARILARADIKGMKKKINSKIKFRENLDHLHQQLYILL